MSKVPADTIHLEQGASHSVGQHKVGVMNIYVDEGTVKMQLVVFDPATGKEAEHTVVQGAELTIGDGTYTVVAITPSRDGKRATAAIAPNHKERVQ
jgi:hypothetical protein